MHAGLAAKPRLRERAQGQHDVPMRIAGLVVVDPVRHLPPAAKRRRHIVPHQRDVLHARQLGRKRNHDLARQLSVGRALLASTRFHNASLARSGARSSARSHAGVCAGSAISAGPPPPPGDQRGQAPSTTLSDIDEQIEQLKAKRRNMVQQRAERFAKIAAQAGLAEVDISDDEALEAFKAIADRFRRPAARTNGSAPPPDATAQSAPAPGAHAR